MTYTHTQTHTETHIKLINFKNKRMAGEMAPPARELAAKPSSPGLIPGLKGGRRARPPQVAL